MRRGSQAKNYLSRAVAVFVALACGMGFLVALGGVAQAATWDGQDANNIGFITLYNSTGNVVTTGTMSTQPVASYFVGSATPAVTGGTPSRAQILFYGPQAGTPDTWSSCGTTVTGATTYPVTTAPAPINTSTLPVAAATSANASLSSLVTTCPSTRPADPNLYQLRLYTSAPLVGTSTTYDSITISVNASAGTWSVAGPNTMVTTGTTVTANPASPQTAPAANITLTAHVTAGTGAAASATGTVTFFQGTTALGSAIAITLSGTTTNSTATFLTTTPPAQGTTAYSARFDPTPGQGYVDSTGPLSYIVNGPADNTSTALVVTAGATAGTPITFTATVTDTTNGATVVNSGTVSFTDTTGANGVHTYGPVNVTTGQAVYNLPVGVPYADSHSVVATFSGVAGTFNGSASAPSTFSQTANACTTCSDVQTITATVPTGTLSITTPYTAAAPLNLGTMALTTSGNMYQATAQFGSTTSATGAIYANDQRSGGLPWTINATASNLTDGSANPNGVINGQNVGLTGLVVVPVSGNSFNTAASNLTLFSNPAASPAVAPGDTGTLGLGNAQHEIAHAVVGTGAVGLSGTLALNAPTSTEAGVFTGTITFTIVGS